MGTEGICSLSIEPTVPMPLSRINRFDNGCSSAETTADSTSVRYVVSRLLRDYLTGATLILLLVDGVRRNATACGRAVGTVRRAAFPAYGRTR